MGRTVQFALAIPLATLCLSAQPIGILFDFADRPDPLTIASMQSEIRQILAPADLDLTFQPVGDSPSTTFTKIIVVRFRGVCKGRTTRALAQFNDPALLEFPALGHTDVSAGRVLPFIQVYCDEVRQFVPFSAAQPTARLFGRALGRVVAHELYHALLSTRDHTRTGIARFAQTPRDLTRDKLTLDARSIGRLRALYAPKKREDDSVEPSSSGETYHNER